RIAVSFAGPLAGFLYLAIILVGFLLINPHQLMILTTVMKAQMGLLGQTDLRDLEPVYEEVASVFRHPTLTEQAFLDLFWINLFWGLMNLLPIWPLDGGQISRDFLSWLVPGNGLRFALGISFLLAAVIAI